MAKTAKAGSTGRRRTNTGGTVKPKPAATSDRTGSGTPDTAGKSRVETGKDSSDNTRPEESTLTGLERERDENLAAGIEQPHPQNAPRIGKTSTVEPPVGRAHVNRNVEIDGEVGAGEILVRAKTMGYYNHVRRREGDVFRLVAVPNAVVEEPILDKDGEPKERQGRILTKRVTRPLTAEEQFSDRWMERVGDETEEKVTTGKAALKQQHDELLAAKHGGKGTGSNDVI